MPKPIAEPASRPQELATESGQPGAAEEGKLGPTPPEDVKLLMGTGLVIGVIFGRVPTRT